jgi:hypothetical protein
MIPPLHHNEQLKIGLQSDDVIIGLGSADRELLATLIALFEDSKLSKQLKENSIDFIDDVTEALDRFLGIKIELNSDTENEENKINSVLTRRDYWLQKNKFSTDDLRTILWIYLRNSLKLSPALAISNRRLQLYATEMVAATIHLYDPPTFSKRFREILNRDPVLNEKQKISLDEVALPVLQEMMQTAFTNINELQESEKQKIYNDIRSNLSGLDQQDQNKILESIDANNFNNAAIRKVMMTGGGLLAFGNAVGAAGFSAYILAAQASAFIPLVSGPALVSFVSVLASPFTLIGGTAAAAYWASNKANSSIQTALSIRVISILALQGLSNRQKIGSGKRKMIQCFQQFDSISEFGELSDRTVNEYRRIWKSFPKKVKKPIQMPDSSILDLMDQPIENLNEFLEEKNEKINEIYKTGWVTGLTIGDIIYSMSAIDPKVIQAADFSRAEDLGNRISFSDFANKITEMAPSSYIGAANNLKGYVAEHVVASQLLLQGHDVELAGTSNEPGWDILVDGEKFQIKSLSNTDGLRTHFNSYDYPVIANSELAEMVPADLEGQVYFVEGYSDQFVTEITENSLSEGADVFNPDIPLITLSVSTAFILRDYHTGRIRTDQAIEQIILDGGTRSGLATIGGFIGSGIGLVVYGPAGALIWGTLMPILAQSQTYWVKNKIQDMVKTKELNQWNDSLTIVTNQLFDKLNNFLETKISNMKMRYKSFGDGVLSKMNKIKITDEGRYLHELKRELARIQDSYKLTAEGKAIELIRFLAHSTIHPVKYQKELKMLQSIFQEKPSLTQSGRRWANDQRSKWF